MKFLFKLNAAIKYHISQKCYQRFQVLYGFFSLLQPKVVATVTSSKNNKILMHKCYRKRLFLTVWIINRALVALIYGITMFVPRGSFQYHRTSIGNFGPTFKKFRPSSTITWIPEVQKYNKVCLSSPLYHYHELRRAKEQVIHFQSRINIYVGWLNLT